MSFQSSLLPGEYDQLLALGDEQGNLHVFDVPVPLRKAKANDIDTFKAIHPGRDRLGGQESGKDGRAKSGRRVRRPRRRPRTRSRRQKRRLPKEGEFDFTDAELEADNAAYAKLQRKLAQEMDIRLLRHAPRERIGRSEPQRRSSRRSGADLWAGGRGAANPGGPVGRDKVPYRYHCGRYRREYQTARRGHTTFAERTSVPACVAIRLATAYRTLRAFLLTPAPICTNSTATAARQGHAVAAT